MKRSLLCLLAFVLSIGAWPWQANADSNAGMTGDGSASNPYIIMNLEQLNDVRQDMTASYKLGANIDASATAGWNNGAGWAPIGDSDAGFAGIFDGNGHVITGLTIDRPSEDHVGLFGYLDQATVKNIGLENASVTGRNYVGGLTGHSVDATIEKAYATGHISGNTYVGGLIGYMSQGKANKAYTIGQVVGNHMIGGLIGEITGGGTVEQSYSTADVSGDSKVGGLAGEMFPGNIRQSYATGKVSGSSSFVGGLVGRSDQRSLIQDAYASGDVAGGYDVGALVGRNVSSILRTYATGKVQGASYAGGLVGENYLISGDIYEANFYDDGNLATTAAMMQKKTYTDNGWDFDGIWDIEEGLSYPILRWSVVDATPPTITVALKKADGSEYMDGSWTSQNVTVTASVYDNRGVTDFVYSLDGGDSSSYGAPLVIADEGEHRLSFLARDEANNEGSTALTVKIDKTAPIIAYSPNGIESTSAAPTVDVSDTGSGVDPLALQYAWTTDASAPISGWQPFSNGASLVKEGVNGDWYLHIKARDYAGNEAVTTSNRFRLTIRNDGNVSSSGPVDEPLPKGTYRIGPDGAEIPFDGGRIEIPAGAMDRPFQLAIREITDANGLPLSGGQRLLSKLIEFKKDLAGKFKKDVTIRLRFNVDSIRKEESEIGLYWLNEETNQWIELTDVSVDWTHGIISGTTDHFTKFAAIAMPIEKEASAVHFSDLKGHWAEASILRMAEKGTVSGYADGTFKPDRSITRAEFAAMLVRAFGLGAREGKSFADTSGHWAKQEIATAYAYGIVQGNDADTFAPDDPITREQMAVMAVNALQWKGGQAGAGFADESRISAWAKEAVAAAAEHGILTGYTDHRIKPQGFASRAEAATILERALKNR